MKVSFLKRRTLVKYISLAGTLGLPLFASAKDRPMVGTEPISIKLPSGEGIMQERLTSCDNAGIPISSRNSRISKLDDFDLDSPCQMTVKSWEGPYYYCSSIPGKNIAAGLEGQPLILAIRAIDSKTCKPLAGAIIDVWHCDAKGRYAGYDNSPDDPAPAPTHMDPTNKYRFCRGALVADEDGIAEFETIYPGYYYGRAIHIHFKAHLGNKSWVTNQALFPEDYNGSVTTRAPYNVDRKITRTPNSDEVSMQLTEYKIIERNNRLIATLTIAA